MNGIVYDCEIKRCILGRNEQAVAGLEYCKGWEDYAGMGVACVGVWDFRENITTGFKHPKHPGAKVFLQEPK